MLRTKAGRLRRALSELRVEGQVMLLPPRAIVVHAAAWEDSPVRPGAARSHCAEAAAFSPSEKLLRSRTYEQAARHPARPL